MNRLVYMNASTWSLRARIRDAAHGRVVAGIMVVLVSVLVLPVALWLVLLVVAMLSRPRDPSRRLHAERPTLQRWLVVAVAFVGGAVLSTAGKPVTGHGVQLLVWFALLPAIGALFWFQRRRVHTIGALWLGSTIAASMGGVVAIVQVAVFGAPRATGVLANSITFGNLALLMGAIAVALHRLIELPGQATQRATFAAAALGLTASILSGSRGGWLAVPLLIALLLWQARSDLTPRHLGRIAIGVLAVVVFANVLSDGMPTSRATASVTNVSGYSRTSTRSVSAGSSEGARIEAWRSAGEAFREQPFSGIGWGNLGNHFQRDVTLGLRNERIATFEHAHNQLLGAAANGGLIGVASMLALFGVPLVTFAQAMRSSERRRQTLGVTGIIVLGSYAVFGLTEAVLENLAPIVFLAVFMAALCAELDATGVDRSTLSRSVRRHPLIPRVSSRSVPTAPFPAGYWSAQPFGFHY